MPGSVVVIRPAPEGYSVDVDPPLPDGLNRARTFADKAAAWGYAQATWVEHRLGLRDETRANVTNPSRPRGPYRKRSFF